MGRLTQHKTKKYPIISIGRERGTSHNRKGTDSLPFLAPTVDRGHSLQAFFSKGSLSGPLAIPFPDFPLLGGAVSFGDGASNNLAGPSAAVAPLSEPGASPGRSEGSDAATAGGPSEGWLLSATPYLGRSIDSVYARERTEWSTYFHRKRCGEINPGRNAFVEVVVVVVVRRRRRCWWRCS